MNSFDIDVDSRDGNIIYKTYKPTYIIDKETRRPIETIDGSVSADIVINKEDKEYVNPENKLLDEEREAKREMYYRQARVLYPEKEEWVLSMAIDAYLEQEAKGIDITTYQFPEREANPDYETKQD
jgi:hypothetical protein